MSDNKIETGNVVITVEIYDPHRPLASDGALEAKTKMRLELNGACALSSADADEVVILLGKLAKTDRRERCQVWNDDDLKMDDGPAVTECGDCKGLWTGDDYRKELDIATNFRMLKAMDPQKLVASLLSAGLGGGDE